MDISQISLGDIAVALAFVAGAIGSIGVICKAASKWFHKVLKSELDPINEKLNKLEKKHDLSDREHAKNYIVRFLADVEQEEEIDQDELRCFWDNYELYKAMGGNSYVHEKVEKLKAKGLL